MKSDFVKLKDSDWLARQKTAGQALSFVLKEFVRMMKTEATMSTKDIESMAVDHIESIGATPTFFNYRGFPGKICASVNRDVVHGIPNDVQLKQGDIVTIDLGVTYEHAIADAAYTFIYGKPKNDKIVEMLICCQEMLYAGIEQFFVGNRLGAIGHAISQRAKESKFGSVTEYGGHGIDEDRLHASPFVANHGDPDSGIIIRPGMSIAIEPMLVLTKPAKTRIKKDKWTIEARDLSAHFEHSITLDIDGNRHVITEHGMSIKEQYA